MKIIGKLALGLLCLLGCTLIAGTVYQLICTKIDEYRYPPIGKLIDIGGHSMHLYCTGIEGPTVVLDAGMGCNCLEWSLIQPEIAKFTRVCSYDRAGYGWSDESPLPRTSLQIVEDLHSLLTQAQIPGPYILVGHSCGGINARLYASQYPDEVAGVILVDSSHEDQLQRLPPMKQTLGELSKYRNLARFMAFIGAVRIFNNFSTDHEMFSSCIPEMYSALESTPKFMGTLFEEMGLFEKSLEQLKNRPHHLGEKPLVVITAGKTGTQCLCQEYSEDWVEQLTKAWNALQKDLVTQSSNSKHIIAENSDHMITRHEPKIVVDEVLEMVDRLKCPTLDTSGSK